jgi:hypothetical protein
MGNSKVGTPLTVCRNSPNQIIREAQAAVVNGKDILAGPDTDVISTLWDRWDGCHFAATGIQRASQLWVDSLTGKAKGR